MVRVRPDMVVPDRCQLHQPYSKGLTTCTGRNGVLKEDLENLKDVLIRIKDDRQEGFHSEANLPGMFLVCKESFEIVSKRYTQAFPLIGASAKTWFDYERDILFFDWGDGFSVATDDACKIQNICFGLAPGSNPIDRDIRATDIAEILEVFCNVKRLTILVEHYQDFEDRDYMTKRENLKDLVLFEPININHTWGPFKWPEIKCNHGGLLCENALRLELGVDMDHLDSLRLDDLAPGSVWNLPEIQWKTLMSATLKTKLETLRKEFELRTGIICHTIHETDKFTIEPTHSFKSDPHCNWAKRSKSI